MLKTIANGLSELPMVKSVALSGSKTSAINDNFSDLDIYVYSDNHVPFEDRARIFSGFESVRINCSPFEEGDEIIDKYGNVYDIMYRSTEWTEWQLDDVWKRHNARLGYTTCFIYNISTSEIIAENDGWFRSLQNETMSDYPEELCMNIIKKNMDTIFMDFERYQAIKAEKGKVDFFGNRTLDDTIRLADKNILISSNWPTTSQGKPAEFSKFIDVARGQHGIVIELC